MKTAHRIVFAVLVLNFWIPTLFYIFAPHGAIAQFVAVGAPFGAPPYPHTEDSVFWRVLGIANVATLGFCCFLLMWNAKRWFDVLVPLAFLKGMSALGWFVAWFAEPMPQDLIAGLFDALTVATMVFFGIAGRRALERAEDPDLPAAQPAK